MDVNWFDIIERIYEMWYSIICENHGSWLKTNLGVDWIEWAIKLGNAEMKLSIYIHIQVDDCVWISICW